MKFLPPAPTGYQLPGLNYSLDTLHVFDSVKAFPDQCEQAIQEVFATDIPQSCTLVDNVIVSGMGGSALGGRIVLSLERQVLKIPVFVSTDYHLPNFAGPKTLVVVSSYSGNTEETLTSLNEARARDCRIFIITSGGVLADIAHRDNVPAYIFNPLHNPSGQPRMGLGYNVISILALLTRCQLVHQINQLNDLPGFLRSSITDLSGVMYASGLLHARLPVLIASEHLKGAAHAFKNQLNENSKNFSVLFDLPEASHHLFEGLTFPVSNPETLTFVFFRSPHYHPRLQKRYDLARQLVTKQKIPSFECIAEGESQLFEAFDLLQAGGYMAFYLSLLNGVDPGPIPWVDWYKDELSKNQSRTLEPNI